MTRLYILRRVWMCVFSARADGWSRKEVGEEGGPGGGDFFLFPACSTAPQKQDLCAGRGFSPHKPACGLLAGRVFRERKTRDMLVPSSGLSPVQRSGARQAGREREGADGKRGPARHDSPALLLSGWPGRLSTAGAPITAALAGGCEPSASLPLGWTGWLRGDECGKGGGGQTSWIPCRMGMQEGFGMPPLPPSPAQLPGLDWSHSLARSQKGQVGRRSHPSGLGALSCNLHPCPARLFCRRRSLPQPQLLAACSVLTYILIHTGERLVRMCLPPALAPVS